MFADLPPRFDPFSGRCRRFRQRLFIVIIRMSTGRPKSDNAQSEEFPKDALSDTPIEVGIMLKRNVGGPGLSLVLFSLFVVVRVTAQGIPQGAASTDTGLGGVNSISGMIVSSNGQR